MTVDISQATLDVIDAIKNKKQIQFVYGSNNCIRELAVSYTHLTLPTKA